MPPSPPGSMPWVLCFYAPSPRAVTALRAAQLARRLPPFVTPVLLFVNASPTDVIAACALVPGATAQFHGDESPEQCWAASGSKIPYLRAARIPLGPNACAFNLVRYASRYSQAQAILLDAHVEGYGGGGHAFNWSLLPPRTSLLTSFYLVDSHLQT